MGKFKHLADSGTVVAKSIPRTFTTLYTKEKVMSGLSIDTAILDQLRDLDDEGGDGIIKELIESFVDQMPGFLTRLGVASDQKDLSEIQLVAHSIKGSSGMIGAVKAARISERLEQKARQRCLEGIEDLVRELSMEFSHLAEELLIVCAPEEVTP